MAKSKEKKPINSSAVRLKMKQLEIENEQGIEPASDLDEDICDENEIKNLFAQRTELKNEMVVQQDKYILHLDGTMKNNANIAVALSDNTCRIYNCNSNQFAYLESLELESNIVDVKFSQENDNLFFTACAEGDLQLWDLRVIEKPVQTFTDPTEEQNKKIKTTFDISCNHRLLTVGTDLFEGDSFLLFWDVRNAKLLGGYWESHTDDITKISFHPTDPNKLTSGSTDGLINIYDLSHTNEEDALLDTFNTESSVDNLLWLSRNKKDFIYCATHTSDIQVWNSESGDIASHFQRSQIAEFNKKKSMDFCYLAGAYLTCNEELFVLIGSNQGDGECVRSLKYMDKTLEPHSILKGNSQRIRSNWFNRNTNTLLTGGEKGILSLWSLK